MPRAPPRVRLKRIDAAIDALKPMGFPEPLIRKTVKNLLKAYGGTEGWIFIEEYSYKLLIDTILEEVEEENNVLRLPENTQPTLMIENQVPSAQLALMIENQVPRAQPTLMIENQVSSAQPTLMIENQLSRESNDRALLPLVSHEDNTDQYNVHSNQVEPSRSLLPPLKKRVIKVHNPSNSSSTLTLAVPCSSNGETSEVKCRKQTADSNQVEPSRSSSPPLKKRAVEVQNSSNTSFTLTRALPCSSNGETSEVKCRKQTALSKISAGIRSLQVKVCSQTKNVSTEIRSPQLFSPAIVESRPAQRRKPCYGWLSSDDDEEPD